MNAGQRFIRQTAKILRVDLSSKDCLRVARVFERYGGTWVGLFRGSVRDVQKVKQIIRFLVKRGLVGKKPDQPADSGSNGTA
jgi:hypothetical protein